MRRRLISLLVAVIGVLAAGSGFVVARSIATPAATTTAVEDVVVDVSLVVVPRREAPGYCEFWLRGCVTVIRH